MGFIFVKKQIVWLKSAGCLSFIHILPLKLIIFISKCNSHLCSNYHVNLHSCPGHYYNKQEWTQYRALAHSIRDMRCRAIHFNHQLATTKVEVLSRPSSCNSRTCTLYIKALLRSLKVTLVQPRTSKLQRIYTASMVDKPKVQKPLIDSHSLRIWLKVIIDLHIDMHPKISY